MPRAGFIFLFMCETLCSGNRYKNKYLKIETQLIITLIAMAVKSRKSTVLGGSNNEILSSNPARDMNVCPRFFFVVL
jgi:hypothetical protein